MLLRMEGEEWFSQDRTIPNAPVTHSALGRSQNRRRVVGERNEGGAVSDSSFGGDGLPDLSARNRDRRGGERGREAPILGHHKGPSLKNVGIFDPSPPLHLVHISWGCLSAKSGILTSLPSLTAGGRPL